MAFANKRGQEGVTLTTILLLVLGVVVVILVVLFATGFFNKLGNATDNLPGSLQAAVSACEIAGSSNLKADYCSTFRKVTINGEEQYQTCDSADIKKLMDQNKLLTESCGTVTAAPAQYCQAQKLPKNKLVGTMHCSGNYTSSTPTEWASTDKYS
jgi:hypothetical protein